jgi:hypothetical protein
MRLGGPAAVPTPPATPVSGLLAAVLRLLAAVSLLLAAVSGLFSGARRRERVKGRGHPARPPEVSALPGSTQENAPRMSPR